MSTNLDDWRAEWEIVLTNGNLSAETATVYLRGVRQFIGWLDEHHPDAVDVGDITRKHIDSWLGHLTAGGMASSTRRVRILAVRFWLDYIADEADSGLDRNPAAKVDLPESQEKPVPVIGDEALSALLRTCSGSDFIALRDTAILRLLLDTGIRRGELVGIDCDDVNLGYQEVTVTGKGGRTRTVPIGGKAALALRKYLRARSRRSISDEALFTAHRQHRNGWRLTGGGVGEMLSRRSERAGLGHLWPHQLRHTWAHDMLDNGAGEQVVERLGGWSPGSKMVKRYGASMADARARKASQHLRRGDRV